MPLRRALSSEFGFSLVEVVIVTGMSFLVILAIASTITMTNKAQGEVSAHVNMDQLEGEMQGAISNNSLCGTILGTASAAPPTFNSVAGTTTPVNIYKPDGVNIRFTSSGPSPYTNQVSVGSIVFQNNSGPINTLTTSTKVYLMGNIQVNVAVSAAISNTQNLVFPITLKVDTALGNQLVACSAINPDSLSATGLPTCVPGQVLIFSTSYFQQWQCVNFSSL